MKNIYTFCITIIALLIGVNCLGQDILISQEGTVNSCAGTVFDSGGFGDNYQSNEDFTITICSNDPTMCLQVEGEFFMQDDDINLYDGTDTSSPSVFNAAGNSVAGPFVMASGCFTLSFQSNGSDNGSGFELDFDCLSSCDCTNVDFSAGGDIGTDDPVCGLTHQLDATINPGYTGTWTSADDIIFSNPNIPNGTVTALTPGTKTMTLSLEDGNGCLLTETIDIDFTDINFDVIADNAVCSGICDGMAEALNITGGLGPYDCNWSSGTLSPNSCSVSNLCPGTNSVTITDDNSCQKEIEFTIDQSSNFQIDEVLVQNVSCSDFCDGALTVVAQDGLMYSIDGGNNFSNNSQFIDVCAGDFDIIAEDINGCQAITTKTITFPNPPTADFGIPTPTQTIYSPDFIIDNNSFGNVVNQWYFGSTDGPLISEEENPSLTLPVTDIGEFQIHLIIEDENGCMDSTFHFVEITEDLLIFMPNAFTPNEDGVNDLFRPVINDVSEDDYLFQVYDRYGNLMFETISLEQGWNGHHINDKTYYVIDGVYTWMVSFKTASSSEKIVQEGSVSILR